MNKTAIKNTVVLKKEDGFFVFESPLLPGCIGAAKTERTAWEHFDHHLEDAYKEYLEGRFSGKYESPGRPAKSLSSFTVRVKPKTKKTVVKLAQEKSCSQGELVDYLLAYYEAGIEISNQTASKLKNKNKATVIKSKSK